MEHRSIFKREKASQGKDFERVLQTCLQSLQDDPQAVDALLARFPEHAQRLRPELEAAVWLRQQRGAFDPRPGFVTASRSRLAARLKQENPRRRGFGFSRETLAFQWHAYRYWISAATLFLLVVQLFSGANQIVRVSPTWLPGDFFYPLKIAQEDAALLLSFDEANDARLHIQFARNRMLEVQALIIEADYDEVPATVINLETHVGRAVHSINRLAGRDQEQARQLANAFQQELTSQTRLVLLIGRFSPASTRAECERLRVIAEDGSSAVQDVLSPSGALPPDSLAAQRGAPGAWGSSSPYKFVGKRLLL